MFIRKATDLFHLSNRSELNILLWRISLVSKDIPCVDIPFKWCKDDSNSSSQILTLEYLFFVTWKHFFIFKVIHSFSFFLYLSFFSVSISTSVSISHSLWLSHLRHSFFCCTYFSLFLPVSLSQLTFVLNPLHSQTKIY